MTAQRKSKAPAKRGKDALVEYCRSLPGATEDVKWGKDLIFSVGGKMFAGFQLPEGEPMGFKVEAPLFDDLVGKRGVIPAPYMAKHSWVSVTDRSRFPAATARKLLAESHRLVAEGLRTPADTTDAVDAFMKSLDHPAKRELQALRAAILAVDPSIREGIKWKSPSFRTTEYFATMNLRGKGIMVVLHFGAKARKVTAGPDSIEDSGKILKWLAKDRAIVQFTGKADVAAKTSAFKKILKQWIVHV